MLANAPYRWRRGAPALALASVGIAVLEGGRGHGSLAACWGLLALAMTARTAVGILVTRRRHKGSPR